MFRMFWALVLSLFLPMAAGVSIAEGHHWLDLRQAGFGGPVQSVAEIQLLPAGQEWVKVPVRNIIYNTEGYAVKVRTYRGAHEFEDKGYIYDAQGRITSSGVYNADGSFVPQQANSYNEAGELIESRYLALNGVPFLTKQYQYDKGMLSKEIHSSQDGSVIIVKVYEYDAAGNMTGIVTQGTNNQFLSRERISEGGKKSECEYEGELAGYGRRIRIQNFENGEIGEICYLSDGSAYQTQICDTKDGDGIKRTVRRADGSIASETSYNAAGDLVFRRLYSTDGTITVQEKLTYLYDHYGNWIERTLLRYDGSQLDWREAEKTIREIVYFS